MRVRACVRACVCVKFSRIVASTCSPFFFLFAETCSICGHSTTHLSPSPTDGGVCGFRYLAIRYGAVMNILCKSFGEDIRDFLGVKLSTHRYIYVPIYYILTIFQRVCTDFC